MFTEQLRPVPSEVEARSKAWLGLWKRAAAYHWSLGIGGIIVSALSAVEPAKSWPMFPALNAILFALITFADPRAKYHKFVRAWRTLDLAILRYKTGRISSDDLVNAVERGEAIISDYEEKEQKTQLPTSND